MSEFHTDLVAALNEISNPSLDGKANYGEYATLAECLRAAKETLKTKKLAVVQLVCTNPDRVVTSLVHASGENISDEGVPIHTADNRNPQKLGAAITYARRYGLCAILGIVGDEDDDGQSATPPQELPMAKKTVPPKQAASPPPAVQFVVAEETPDEDWVDWADKARIKIKGHQDVAQLKFWFTQVQGQMKRLKEQDPKLCQEVLAEANKRKAQLLNKEN